MRYTHPGTPGAIVSPKPRHGNFTGGEFASPVKDQYFTNTTPVTGEVIGGFPRLTAEDIGHAFDAAHATVDAWGRTSVQDRSSVLLKITDRIEQNLESLAVTETRNNDEPVRETLNVDTPLAMDHLRYFADCICVQEGPVTKINERTVAYHTHEPLGVVGQTTPQSSPLLMATWKLAPALAVDNYAVLKPAEQTPLGICVLMELIGDLLPVGVLNVVHGYGKEASEALVTSKRIAKIALTGSTPVGPHITKYTAENIIPSTVELGGKSPDTYFEDITQAEPNFVERAAGDPVLGFFNQGGVCARPSRALVQESIYSCLIDAVLTKVTTIKRDDPLDIDTMVDVQASEQQLYKTRSYLEIMQEEDAGCLVGGDVGVLPGNPSKDHYIRSTLLKGDNSIHMFQEETFGPVITVTTFEGEAQASQIVGDTDFGLGAGLWVRGIDRAHRTGRAIKAGHVWANCYHLYPAHAASGGYKKSDVGHETHKTMPDHCQRTKNLLVSYNIKPLGFF